MVHPSAGCTGVGGTGWVPGGRYTGYRVGTGRVVYRVLTHPWCRLGPGNTNTPLVPCPRALQTPPRSPPHTRLPHPRAPGLQIPASGPIRARFRHIFLKVSQNRRVSPKSMMRPGILPISKRAPETMTLNSWDFHIRQPSLPRNNWSRI